MIAIYLKLYWEFFKTGLFAVGGGMATLPFLQNIGQSTGWYSYTDLMNMLAVSESTPGPIGINMATYVGYTAAGVPGAVIATLGEVTPSIIVILIVAAVLNSFRNNKYVDQAFMVVLEVLTAIQRVAPESGALYRFTASAGGLADLFNWQGLVLAAVLLVLTNWVKKVKNWHPIVFIGLSAAVGVALRFAGV